MQPIIRLGRDLCRLGAFYGEQGQSWELHGFHNAYGIYLLNLPTPPSLVSCCRGWKKSPSSL